MAGFYRLLLIFTLPLLLLIPAQSEAQTRSYEILPSPDIWYNSVDGIKLGVRLRGQVPGTFEDGPHRLDTSVWFNVWLPDLPVSYRLSYIEPISAWSDYGSEANIELVSSVNTGYQTHGVGFNKRWQTGFDERRFTEVSIYNTFEKSFDDEYRAFPLLWSDRNKILSSATVEYQNDNPLGWYNVTASGSVQYLDQTFGEATLTATQLIPFNSYWGLKFRGFMGVASSSSYNEYLYSRSNGQAIDRLDSRLARAKGTIPQPWIESGNIQISGGPNLRGYTSQDVSGFLPCVNCFEPRPILYSSFASVNAEFDYLNPVALIFQKIPYLSEFLSFRSYLFFDAGKSLGFRDSENSEIFADAGAGFSLSLNIPDYLGKPRGFVLRYELPFWLSDPGMDENEFQLRHLFAIGAVISF